MDCFYCRGSWLVLVDIPMVIVIIIIYRSLWSLLVEVEAEAAPTVKRPRLADQFKEPTSTITSTSPSTSNNKGEVEDAISSLKNKVRSLACQNTPSEALILLTLDELAKTARQIGHAEAESFEEFARHASRNQ